MEISRVTGIRQADILKIKKSDLNTDGLYVQQNKTGKKQIFEYSPTLLKAIELAKSTSRKVESIYLITTKYGTKYTSSGFQTAWQRLMKKSGVEPFTFHDLRAKAGSEASDASKLLGNTAAIAEKHYMRKPTVITPNE
jgi:integrase